MDTENTETLDSSSSSGMSDYIEAALWAFIILTLGYAIKTFFRVRKVNREPPPPRLEKLVKRDYTVEELQAYRGIPKTKRIFLAVCGNIYDVSRRPDMYGPGGSYEVLAGKDGSRALALMSTDEKDAVSDISGLSKDEEKTLENWASFFKERYVYVGKVITDSSDGVAGSPEDEVPIDETH